MLALNSKDCQDVEGTSALEESDDEGGRQIDVDSDFDCGCGGGSDIALGALAERSVDRIVGAAASTEVSDTVDEQENHRPHAEPSFPNLPSGLPAESGPAGATVWPFGPPGFDLEEDRGRCDADPSDMNRLGQGICSESSWSTLDSSNSNSNSNSNKACSSSQSCRRPGTRDTRSAEVEGEAELRAELHSLWAGATGPGLTLPPVCIDSRSTTAGTLPRYPGMKVGTSPSASSKLLVVQDKEDINSRVDREKLRDQLLANLRHSNQTIAKSRSLVRNRVTWKERTTTGLPPTKRWPSAQGTSPQEMLRGMQKVSRAKPAGTAGGGQRRPPRLPKSGKATQKAPTKQPPLVFTRGERRASLDGGGSSVFTAGQVSQISSSYSNGSFSRPGERVSLAEEGSCFVNDVGGSDWMAKPPTWTTKAKADATSGKTRRARQSGDQGDPGAEAENFDCTADGIGRPVPPAVAPSAGAAPRRGAGSLRPLSRSLGSSDSNAVQGGRRESKGTTISSSSTTARSELPPEVIAFQKNYSSLVGRTIEVIEDPWIAKREQRYKERDQQRDYLFQQIAELIPEDYDYDNPRAAEKASKAFGVIDLSGFELPPSLAGSSDSESSSSGSDDDEDELKSLPDHLQAPVAAINSRRRSSNAALASAAAEKRHAQLMQGYDELRSFLEDREGASLIAWVKHFDKNGDLKVSREEFRDGLISIGFRCDDDMMALFDELDMDGDGELGLEEIDKAQAKVWQEFRHWCTDKYYSMEHILVSILGSLDGRVTQEEFAERLFQQGWTRGCEALIYASLDSEGTTTIGEQSFRWFEFEHKRAELKKRAEAMGAQASQRRKHCSKSDVSEFKAFLKRRFGTFLRAWRCCLTQTDSMLIYKREFIKACQKLGWEQNDPEQLWNAVDVDCSGFATLDELDFASARSLALFKQWIDECFGSAASAFTMMAGDAGFIRAEGFGRQMSVLGYRVSTAEYTDLFHGLDKAGRQALIPEDLVFLDRWKPLPYLVVEPNQKAADEVLTLLLDKYTYLLRAWRLLLDRSSLNRCTWFDFCASLDSLGYKGDAAGAWRALDKEQNNYLSLSNFDSDAAEILAAFRTWADEEFGGTKPAFAIFDVDGSNDISRLEFRQACKIFGFRLDPGPLFSALDINSAGSLTMEQISFLDKWQRDEEEEGGPRPMPKQLLNSEEASSSGPRRNGAHIVQKKRATVQNVPGTTEVSAAKAYEAATAAARIHYLEDSMRPRGTGAIRAMQKERDRSHLAALPPAARPGHKAWHSPANQWRKRQFGVPPDPAVVADDLAHRRPPPEVGPPHRRLLSLAHKPLPSSVSEALRFSCRSRWEPAPDLPTRVCHQAPATDAAAAAGPRPKTVPA